MKDMKAKVSVTPTDVVMNFRGKEVKAPYSDKEQRSNRIEKAISSLVTYSKNHEDARILVAMESGTGRVSPMHIVGGKRKRGLPDGFSMSGDEIVGESTDNTVEEPPQRPQEAAGEPSAPPVPSRPSEPPQTRRKPSLSDRLVQSEEPLPEPPPAADDTRRREEVASEPTVAMPIVDDAPPQIDDSTIQQDAPERIEQDEPDDDGYDEPLANTVSVSKSSGEGIGEKIGNAKDALFSKLSSLGSHDGDDQDADKRKKLFMIIGGSLVVVLVLALGVIFVPKMFSGGDEPQAETTKSAAPSDKMETAITPSPVLDGWSRNSNWYSETTSGFSSITPSGYLAFEKDNALHVKLSDGVWSSEQVQGDVKSIRTGTIKDKDGNLVDGAVLLTSNQVVFAAFPSDKKAAVQADSGDAQNDSFLSMKGTQPLLSYNDGAGAAVLSISEGLDVHPIPMNSAPISVNNEAIYSAQGNGTVSITPLQVSNYESETVTMVGPDPKKSVPVKWGNVTKNYTIIVWDSVDTYEKDDNHKVTVAIHDTNTGKIKQKFESTNSIYKSPRSIENEEKTVIAYGDIIIPIDEDGQAGKASQVKDQRAFSYAGNDQMMFINGDGQLSQIGADGKTIKAYAEQIATPFGIVNDGRLAVIQNKTIFLLDKIDATQNAEPTEAPSTAPSDGDATQEDPNKGAEQPDDSQPDPEK